jgi:predicted phosphate transport protein (TIGR00153 family)
MFGFFKQTNNTIENINRFFDTIDQALLVFKEGIQNYLYNHTEQFNNNLHRMSGLETEADELRHQIESNIYSLTTLMEVRGEIMKLIEEMDDIVDILENSLFQFEIERPYIPVELNTEFVKLTELSTSAVECVITAAKAYFRLPETMTEKIHRVYFYEKETDKQAQGLKRKVFHTMNNLKLSEKFHLRYFALHIENMSDAAEKAADLLLIMSIKRGL